MSNFLFKDRDGQTPLPYELQKGLKIKTIQTVGELDEFEEDNIAKGLSWLAKQKENPGKYMFWLKLHKKLFENVWSWAGKIRTHELANSDFKLPYEICPQLYQLEKDLEIWTLTDVFTREELAARFHEKMETIHPFANGNGRFGRIITEQICKYYHFSVPVWGRKFENDSAARRRAYISALIHARRHGAYSDLVAVMFT